MANKKTNGRKKPYYTAQRAVSERNKNAGLKRRARRLNAWIAKGVNKKGKPVLTLAARASRASIRKADRTAKRDERRKKWREEQKAWEQLNPGKKQFRNKRKFKPDQESE